MPKTFGMIGLLISRENEEIRIFFEKIKDKIKNKKSLRVVFAYPSKFYLFCNL